LLPWATEQGIYFLEDLDLSRLQQFRNTWDVADLTARKRQERIRSFFNFCVNNGWVARNPAASLSKVKVRQKPTDYFTRSEYKKLLGAISKFGKTEIVRKRLRAFVELLRWSGLSIRDAVMLERARLDDDDRLFLYRAKTGVPVYLPLPSEVSGALRNVPDGARPNVRYFFWSGDGKPKSAVADWQRALYRLYKLADLKLADGTPKRCHAHMFRDTFAVESLLAGIPLQDVSLLLGHSSIKTTERHYAPFVKARQELMVKAVRKAWTKMR
jgi:integrase/recombinase XerD